MAKEMMEWAEFVLFVYMLSSIEPEGMLDLGHQHSEMNMMYHLMHHLPVDIYTFGLHHRQ